MLKTKKRKRFVIIISITIALIVTVLFVLYGPWASFRNFWITTSMKTLNHQYLARIFYSDDTIEKVMADNVVIEVDESINLSLIDKNYEEVTKYSDRYERKILNRDKNDIYKVINIDGSGYNGFLVAIYDPSKIKLVLTRYLEKQGELLTTYADIYDADIAINASGYYDPLGKNNGGTPTGSVVKDGKLVFSGTPKELSGGVIGFDYNNNLILSKDSMNVALKKYNLRDAIEFGPFLIINGKPSFIKGNGGWGIAPRTAIGQRKDGIVLLLIIDGRKPGYSLGADMVELTRIMTNYKAINAANLDGGASTTLVVNKILKNKPAWFYSDDGQRALPNAWIVTK